MSSSASTSFASLIAPRRTLVSCVPAYIVRNTLGTSGPGFNHYPASPLCSVCWMLHGPTALVAGGTAVQDVTAQAGDAVFSGPQQHPWTTWNAGPAHFFVAMFYPDALHALTGVDMAAQVGQFVPAGELLGASWQELTPALMAATSDAARTALVDDFLDARWQAVRSQADSERGVLGDWVRRLAVQAASSGIGRSARVAERRVKSWAGLPMRTLQRMGRAEQALLAARAEQQDGRISWADVAAGAGYADQSHLTRETRALTGLSPAALAYLMEHDDSYWMYRIWS
jgi:AraC-like DNA-binding protein